MAHQITAMPPSDHKGTKPIPIQEQHMSVSTDPIVVTETYNAPLQTVWKAITEQEQMRQWFFEPIHDFQPEVGFETQFTVHVEGQGYVHLWKVTEADPPHKVSYQWQYGGYPGTSVVTWELSEVPNGTRLTFTQTGSESFPQDNPMFTREAAEQAWEYFVQKTLKGYLEAESR